MEACYKCGAHQWFTERAWSVIEQVPLYRVACKQCGRSAPWCFSEEEAIKAWNVQQAMDRVMIEHADAWKELANL